MQAFHFSYANDARRPMHRGCSTIRMQLYYCSLSGSAYVCSVVLFILMNVGADVGNGYILIQDWKELYDKSMCVFACVVTANIYIS